MKLDGAIFPIEQRSVGGCIDLAIVFLRQHFFSVLRLLACFAVPSVLLTWWLIDRTEFSLNFCVFLFFMICPIFGAALVGAAGHRVFGDRFSTRNGLKLLRRRFLLIFVLTTFVRFLTLLASMFFLVPGFMVATRYGFLAEILLLEDCPTKKYETRLSDLLNDTFQGLVGRLIAIVAFFCISVLSLFILVDVASSTLFGFPIFIGRISDLAYFREEMGTLLSRDPRVATVFVSVMWLVYPVTRLAWMFCFLDVRIRKEGWDVELDFKVEALRLEAAK